MKKTLQYIFAIAPAIAFFIAPNFATAADAGYNFEKIFYLAQYNAESGVKSVEENWQKIDILAPQMYVIKSNFSLSGGLGPKLKKAVEDHNIKVMPLVANSNFSQKLMHKLLESETGQKKVINALIKEAKSKNFIGWQFDFENIDYHYRGLYNSFVYKAGKEFKKNGLIVSVAVVSRWSDYEDTNAFKNWSGVYDYERLAQYADFISIMAYDDPQSKGPTASVNYVNKVLAYAKAKIPGPKLSLGVPLYYWKWNADTNKKVGSGFFKNILAIMEKYIHILDFNESLGVASLAYSYNNKNYKIWFENQQSFKLKMDIIKNNGLRGFSAWLLGGEDQNIWSII